jgi:phosphoribosyl-ATP pyrophosphohydrolase
MALQELYPDIERIYSVIEQRKKERPKGSSTIDLLNTGWVSKKNDESVQGKLKKKRGIGDKLIEEGVEVAIAGATNNREDLISESSQAVYYMVVGWVAAGINTGVVFRALDEMLQDKEVGISLEPVSRLAQHAGVAIGRVGIAGSRGDRELLTRRSAQALVALNTVWEASDISSSDVGKKI